MDNPGNTDRNINKERDKQNKEGKKQRETKGILQN
jgi:hypothetical protein